jgi:hypothetical protein
MCYLCSLKKRLFWGALSDIFIKNSFTAPYCPEEAGE